LCGDTIITGVSASGASGPGATFRGSIVALNAQTGRILWQSYSLPDNGGIAGGYAGPRCFAASSQSSGRLVYGTFGQTYTEPASVTACHTAHGGFTEACEQRDPFEIDRGVRSEDWSAAVVVPCAGARTVGQGMREPAGDGDVVCAEADGEKWDLGGSGANVMRLRMDGHWRDVVGFGEKSGCLRTAGCEHRRIHLEHAHRARRRSGRHGVGNGSRW
jgi:polyvinyl alcohol dehydrogenase (cytochrome)